MDVLVKQDEGAQLQHVEQELLRLFAYLPPTLVVREFEVATRAFDGARVRPFVPLLVHKRATAALRGRTAAYYEAARTTG